MIDPSGEGRFRILGPMEVWTGRDWTQVTAPKWRALLATLLLRAGRPVATDELVEGLWSGAPPTKAVNLISVYVHRLRRLIGDPDGAILLTRDPGYQLVLAPGDLDADRFARLEADGRAALAAGQAKEAAALLGGALGLWRGPALMDVPGSALVAAETARLEESRISALEARIEADLECGRAEALAPELRRLLADHPLRERLWGLLIRALHAAGRQAEALEAYAEARDVIAEELGVDPGIELRQIYLGILRADAEVERSAPAEDAESAAHQAGPGARTDAGRSSGPAAPPPAQLPADIPDFTGRSDEIRRIQGLLADAASSASPGAVPVVVLMGSGGLGKTTLAVHMAHRMAASYPDGQLHASLLGATEPVDPAEVLARFLRDLGADPGRIPVSAEERAAAFRTRLASRRVLLVLDDARDADQVRPLLPGNASCAVLITSRSRLPELAGARILDLDVLPPAHARTLFARIAGEERVQAEPEAAEQVLAACAGLPLAIRIAGARLAARGGWNVHYLAERLSDERRRLDELRVGNLAVRASFEVSFASLAGRGGGLDPTRAFRLLGLWTGPSISLPAAAALLGRPEQEAADALEMLVDAHLLDSPVPDRYRFHDLLRVFAADRVRIQESEQDRGDATRRLVSWYLHTVEAAARMLSPQRTPVPLAAPEPVAAPLSFASMDEALAWCEEERAGLVAATRLAEAAGLHEAAWKLPAAAMSFFYRRRHWADWVATHQVGLASARALGDRLGEAWMLNNLGMAYGVQHMAESVECFERALAIYRELGQEQGAARAATNVANAYLDLGQFDQALEAARRSLGIQRETGSRYGEGLALGVVGVASRELGLLDEAVEHTLRALAIFTELGEQAAEADSLGDLSDTYLRLGRVDEAADRLVQSLAIWRGIGNRHGEAVTLRQLGRAHLLSGHDEEGRRLLTQALALFEDLTDRAEADATRAEVSRLRSPARDAR